MKWQFYDYFITLDTEDQLKLFVKFRQKGVFEEAGYCGVILMDKFYSSLR